MHCYSFGPLKTGSKHKMAFGPEPAERLAGIRSIKTTKIRKNTYRTFVKQVNA